MKKIGTGKLPDSNDMYITLNNKPVYLQMALDQSYHPLGFYTFPTDDFMREEILRVKDIGLNGLRIHIKTEIFMMNSECGAVWGYEFGTGDTDIFLFPSLFCLLFLYLFVFFVVMIRYALIRINLNYEL